VATNIVVPEVGESVVDARVAKWLKQPGDAVVAGEPLVELETDKVDVEVAAPKPGVLVEILHNDGADVKIGEVIGRIDDAAGAATGAASAPGTTAGSAAKAAAGTTAPPATPSARKLAREENVPLGQVTPDGPRVTKVDVARAMRKGGSSAMSPPAPPAGVERVRMSKRRATIARRLVEAQQTAAMLTTFNEVDMSAVMALRERQKEAFKARYGVGLGIASFFIKAAVVGLKDVPRLNAEIDGDDMVIKRHYDIGVAVGAAEGLVVPVIRGADALSFAGIEQTIRDFAARAASGSLTLEDLRGGTFSVTNGGVYGSLMSTPILNPPQAGILGLHAIKERPVGVGGQIVLRPMMYTALTYDHRIVDGAEAVRFLVRIKELVEDPARLLVEG
jgi:2-oxoglutarate dehydrogenase E2 component (dihydrolipoamide succinyltransferase)